MKKVICFLEIAVLCIFLCGCRNLKQESERATEEKVDSEIEFIEDTIISIINQNIKNEYFEENNTNWESVKKDALKINTAWNTLELDCTDLNISNEKIMECGNNINVMILSMSQKDEIGLLEILWKIDENLSNIKNEYSNDKNYTKKMQLKVKTIKTYWYAYQQKFEMANEEIKKMQEFYKNLKNDENYKKENNYNLNKIALLIEEYNIGIQSRNIDLIKIKYLDLIEKI